MTTFRSEASQGGPGVLSLASSPRESWGRRGRIAFALALLAAPAFGQELSLPSGLPARLFDVVLEGAGAAMAPDASTDPEALETAVILDEAPLTEAPAEEGETAPADANIGGIARFRLVVPDLGEDDAGYEAVAGDFLWICEQVALPALAANAWSPTEVVVSFADRETEFGASDPEAVQFFEGFRIADGTCVPQAF